VLTRFFKQSRVVAPEKPGDGEKDQDNLFRCRIKSGRVEATTDHQSRYNAFDTKLAL
jgi:hypothetical protein